MPDDAGERTEPPTPRRRREARREGQIAKSPDLSGTVAALAGLIGLELFGPRIWGGLLSVMRTALAGDGVLTGGSLIPFAGSVASEMFKVMAPLAVILFVGVIIIMYAQVGLLLTINPIKPKLGKLNPISGVKRMFSARTFVQAGMNFVKMSVLAAVAYLTIRERMAQIISAMDMDYVVIYCMLADLLFRLAIRLAIVLLVLALLDYVYQRYRHEKDLKMTKEEVKEEMRRMEGDPVVKRRRREVQLQLALQRLRSAVPKADVVVTNPTHLAIALRYAPEEMNAPKVVAKGADYVALRIRQIAASAGVPIVERRQLVRAMFDAVEVGQEIPEKFFRAVAEILAYVYELTGQQVGPQPVPVG